MFKRSLKDVFLMLIPRLLDVFHVEWVSDKQETFAANAAKSLSFFQSKNVHTVTTLSPRHFIMLRDSSHSIPI